MASNNTGFPKVHVRVLKLSSGPLVRSRGMRSCTCAEALASLWNQGQHYRSAGRVAEGDSVRIAS